jgi:hypothetical protein
MRRLPPRLAVPCPRAYPWSGWGDRMPRGFSSRATDRYPKALAVPRAAAKGRSFPNSSRRRRGLWVCDHLLMSAKIPDTRLSRVPSLPHGVAHAVSPAARGAPAGVTPMGARAAAPCAARPASALSRPFFGCELRGYRRNVTNSEQRRYRSVVAVERCVGQLSR